MEPNRWENDMRNGKLSKREIENIHRTWDIVERYVMWKATNGEKDDAYVLANELSNTIMWFLGEIR